MEQADLVSLLHGVNHWWWQAPYTDCSISWWDRDTWPDPWSLLQRPRFCQLARALGMLYTLAMIDRPEVLDAELVEHSGADIVRVCQGRYVLNWCQDVVTRTSGLLVHQDRHISIQQIRSQIN